MPSDPAGYEPSLEGRRSVSPCIGVCELDEASGFCGGCARTGEEIASWRDMTGDERTAIWDALPPRFEALGVGVRRLPWSADDVRKFIEITTRPAAGTWVLGVVGGVGEFTVSEGESVAWHRDGECLQAVTDRAALRFQFGEEVRAFEMSDGIRQGHPHRVVLALPRSRGRLTISEKIADLGADEGAIRPEDRGLPLFDLGLGRASARFCVRVQGVPLAGLLKNFVGCDLWDCMRGVGPKMVEASPVRVIESGLGRVEIATPIPAPGGRSPDGPHTHLLPDHLALGRDLPVGMDLPPSYLPGAVFYPQKSA